MFTFEGSLGFIRNFVSNEAIAAIVDQMSEEDKIVSGESANSLYAGESILGAYKYRFYLASLDDKFSIAIGEKKDPNPADIGKLTRWNNTRGLSKDVQKLKERIDRFGTNPFYHRIGLEDRALRPLSNTLLKRFAQAAFFDVKKQADKILIGRVVIK